MKWFSYDADSGLELHKTAKDAKAVAAEAIEHYLDEGWNEEVDTVCWGQVIQQAVMVNKRPDPDGVYDYLCEYELGDVEEKDDGDRKP